MKKDFITMIESPIISAIRDESMIDAAISSNSDIIFLLNDTIYTLENSIRKIKASGKSVFIHFDLTDGFDNSLNALHYISEKFKPDGIISTKSNIVKEAKKLGLYSIQRIFLLDSMNFEHGLKSIISNRPDACEILPGSLHKITKRIVSSTDIPIITGGLIQDKEDIIECIKSGAVAVSTTDPDLWNV
jgi:glycerol uptake operon antiterminator